MKREMPTLMFVIGMGLLLFFVYAAFAIGLDVRNVIATHRSNMSAVVDAGVRFVVDNRIILAGAAAVLILVKLLSGSTGPARSKG